MLKKFKKNEQSYNTNMICFVYLFEKKKNKIKNKKSRHLPKLRHLTRPVKKLKIA